MDDKVYNKERFEFLLYINGKIVCQRYFNIPNFNENSLKSLELKELAEDCIWLIEDDLKEKSKESLWFYFKEYEKQTEEEIDRRGISAKRDDFEFEIKVDDRSVIRSIFSGNYYPPKVRYSIDIRSLIPIIVGKIRSTLSERKYTRTYGEVKL